MPGVDPHSKRMAQLSASVLVTHPASAALAHRSHRQLRSIAELRPQALPRLRGSSAASASRTHGDHPPVHRSLHPIDQPRDSDEHGFRQRSAVPVGMRAINSQVQRRLREPRKPSCPMRSSCSTSPRGATEGRQARLEPWKSPRPEERQSPLRCCSADSEPIGSTCASTGRVPFTSPSAGRWCPL